MRRFYKVAITKWPVGTAVQHREPAVQGKVIVKVTDSTTGGDYKVFVVDAGDDQHKANLALPAVEGLSESQAVKLAAKYQPKRTLTQFNPLTGKKEKTTIPTCDLKKLYQKRE
jgi:hypothetical protein